ncbi:MAG: hypothetical protein RSA12_10840, partial [Clostridia bacterium]
DNVADQVSNYWQDIDQDTLLSVLKGIFSMTGKANLPFVTGHTHDISTKTGDARPRSTPPFSKPQATTRGCSGWSSAIAP